MFVIPTLQRRRTPPVVFNTATADPVIRGTINVYTTQTYPLPVLQAYSYLLFDPFVIAPSEYTVLAIENNTDSVTLNANTSVSTLTANAYVKSFNTLTLLTSTNKDIGIHIALFITLNQNTVDLSYLDGWTLEGVNITGHRPVYTYTDKLLTVNTPLLYPVRCALYLQKTVNTITIPQREVYSLTASIGSPQYVKYNGQLYLRTRNTIPKSREFSTNATGALLWI
jgi:hypothetical protein